MHTITFIQIPEKIKRIFYSIEYSENIIKLFEYPSKKEPTAIIDTNEDIGQQIEEIANNQQHGLTSELGPWKYCYMDIKTTFPIHCAGDGPSLKTKKFPIKFEEKDSIKFKVIVYIAQKAYT